MTTPTTPQPLDEQGCFPVVDPSKWPNCLVAALDGSCVRENLQIAADMMAGLRQQLAARDAEIERAVKAEREACKQIAADQLKLEQISGDGTARTILQLIDARTTPSTEGGR